MSKKTVDELNPGDILSIGKINYELVQNPNPKRKHKIDVRHGTQGSVVKIQKQGTSQLFALKFFNDRYRHISIIERIDIIRAYSTKTEGLQAAPIQVCDPKNSIFKETLTNYPFLEYSVLMPWLPYPTWRGLRSQSKTDKALVPTYNNCRLRSLNLAKLLHFLESMSIAHCDICPGNIIISENNDVFVIDFENVFHPSLQLSPPWGLPFGQDGYRHHQIEKLGGQWLGTADLFGGALLLVELLLWYSPEIREHSLNEKFFNQADLHNSNIPSLKVIRKLLGHISSDCLYLFDKAWRSKSLQECPTMKSWLQVISNLPATEPQFLAKTHTVTRRRNETLEPKSSPMRPTPPVAKLDSTLSPKITSPIERTHTVTRKPSTSVPRITLIPPIVNTRLQNQVDPITGHPIDPLQPQQPITTPLSSSLSSKVGMLFVLALIILGCFILSNLTR